MTQPNTEPGEIALQAGKDISLDVYENPDKCGKSFAITIQRAINDSTAALRREIAELQGGLDTVRELRKLEQEQIQALHQRLATAEAALLRIFEWAERNKPYPDCKIEGNTLLQDICEKGLGYWPPGKAIDKAAEGGNAVDESSKIAE